MTDMLAAVRSQIPPSCLARSIRGQGCQVSLAGVPADRLIIDFDHPGSPLPINATRCDYLLLAVTGDGSNLVAPIELKSGEFDFGAVQRQLQAGANAAERLVPDECKEQARFLPVLASRNVPKMTRKQAKQARHDVRFGNQQEPIRRIRCGAPLPAS